jgi:GalNAc-alpha-(1->4)-GalNAc-alpha-(1->3)-diNAcBac-PP-undecaprenol alpha-1,4-N-acetyl-D-galactosaminyltransferase
VRWGAGALNASRRPWRLANAWAARGTQVVIVPTFLGEQQRNYHLHERVRVVPLRERIGSNGFLGKWRGLRALVREEAPDVVVSFLTNVNVTALVTLAGLRIPLVISERVDPAATVELHWPLRVLRKYLYRFADALVVQTQETAGRYLTLLSGAPSIHVVPNPLPAALHQSTDRARGLDAASGNIVAMGRLTAQKQFDLLIRAFATVFAQRPEWTLTIWGDGPLRDVLQQLIDQFGLAQQVRLAGFTNQPWRALHDAQMFVLSSAYEGFPNSMLEAMALGVPCVAFDCPAGPRDLASGGAAVLVPSGDTEALARALKQLAEDPAARVRLGHAAAESVRSRFSEASVLGLWDAIFTQLRGRRR